MNKPTQTGYEIHNENGTIDMSASIDKMIVELEKRNPGKYASFLKSLKKIKTVIWMMWVPYAQERSDILYYVYFWLRLLDDVVDWDTPIYIEPTMREDILSSKKITTDIEKNKKDLFDVLIWTALHTARDIWVEANIIRGVQWVVDSLSFDAKRISYAHKHGIPEEKTRDELHTHFDGLDVEGTIFDTWELFGLNPHYAVEILRPLWFACRYVYTLQDILQDPWQWLLNIPKEDMQKYNITSTDIQNISIAKNITQLPRSVKEWVAGMFDQIDEQLRLYNQNMKEKRIPLTYTQSKFKTWLYNMVLKKLVLKKWYVDEIEDVRKQFNPIIFEVKNNLMQNFQ